MVDFFSLLYAAALIQVGGGPDVFADSPPGWNDRVAEMLEKFRTVDGGYAKAVGATSGSTYHTFLVALCYELLGRPLPESATGGVVRSSRAVGMMAALSKSPPCTAAAPTRRQRPSACCK